jgi:hypothetical protein
MTLFAINRTSEVKVALSALVSVEAWLIIVQEGNKTSSRETPVSEDRILRVTAPTDSKMHELPLVTIQSGAVIASRPFEVR